MGARWYVLQVVTGKEVSIRNALQRERILSKVPREFCPIRRGGRWREVEKILFPGYVFVGCEELDTELYYAVGRMSGVLCFVGHPRPQPIAYEEAERLALLAPDNDPLLPSTVRVEGDEMLITDGILKEFGPDIIKIERRRRRAKVRLHILGEDREVPFSIRLEDERQAGCNG